MSKLPYCVYVETTDGLTSSFVLDWGQSLDMTLIFKNEYGREVIEIMPGVSFFRDDLKSLRVTNQEMIQG